MKSLLLLSLEVTKELGDMCGASTARDCKTITSRFEHEGSSFLTITLPAFSKDLERALSIGRVDHDMFLSFSRHAGLPRFLGGFLDLVFDRSTGRLLDNADPEGIRAIRQICLLHSKVLIDCSSDRKKKAIEGFVECERQVEFADSVRTESQRDDFRYYANLLFRDVFLDMEKSLFNEYTTPKHGPGKTADRLSGNAKFDQRVWTDRLEEVFPAMDYLLPGHHYSSEYGAVTWLEPGRELPVKVTLVPKTPKTPRIIAIEPTCMQYMQQAILKQFLSSFNRDDFLKKVIGFEDQLPNQEMALRGSREGTLATLDLSEASDRVSVEHVRLLLDRHDFLLKAVLATRSQKAQVPGVGVIPLSKFASMGSALCFPIEAMVFTTVIFSSIGKALNRRLTRKEVTLLSGMVRVYGDDLVVPTDFAMTVVEQLELFGFRVNSSKSFWTGKFRESCGKEYYSGHDVSIVKNRRVFPASRTDAREVVSLVSLRNQLYEAGLWKTVRYLDDRIRKLIPFPIVESTSSGLGRISFLPYQTERVDDQLHRPLVRVAKLTGKPPISKISGTGALLKWFLKEGLEPFELESYERQGRPDTVKLKVRWTQPF